MTGPDGLTPERQLPHGYEMRDGTINDIYAMAMVVERINAVRDRLEMPKILPVRSEIYADLVKRWKYEGYWSHLVFDGDRLAGLITGYPGTWRGEDDKSNSEYLWLAMVDPDYQSQGIGKTLLHMAESTARKSGRSQLVLYVPEANDGAIRLYEAEGYKEDGTTYSESQQAQLVRYVLSLE